MLKASLTQASDVLVANHQVKHQNEEGSDMSRAFPSPLPVHRKKPEGLVLWDRKVKRDEIRDPERAYNQRCETKDESSRISRLSQG